MKVWVIADTHFGHQLLKDLGVRGDNYESEMWESMNKLVKEGDLLIHLGDLAFKPQTEIGQALKMIKGNKVLIRGNHDGGYEKYYEYGFNFVCDEFRLSYKEDLIFSHEPVRLPFVGLNIHGHLHGDHHRLQGSLEWYREMKESKLGFQHLDLAPEIWGNRVVSLDEILKKVRSGSFKY